MMAFSLDVPTDSSAEIRNVEHSNHERSDLQESNIDSTNAELNGADCPAEPVETEPIPPPVPVETKPSLPPAPPVRKRKPFILLPLYIWPGTGVWDPLFEAAEANPDLDLWVIINPFNGPGLDVLPEPNYLDVLSRLTTVPNAKMIGYVRCDYGRRPLEEILAEIDKYASWGKELVKCGDERTILVDGLFIDETPSDTEFVEYLATLSHAAKTALDRKKDDASAPPPPPSSSRKGPSVPVIYNPGVVVDSAFYLAADYIVVYENSVNMWEDKWVRHNFERLFAPLKSRSIVIAHSAEGDESVADISCKAFEEGFTGQYVTSAPGYEAWCPGWGKYCADVARRSAESN